MCNKNCGECSCKQGEYLPVDVDAELAKIPVTSAELIEMSIYELSRLGRVMEIPERGYTRNVYNSIHSMLAGALQNEIDKKG